MDKNGWGFHVRKFIAGTKISSREWALLMQDPDFTVRLRTINAYACATISLLVCLISLSGCLAKQSPWSSREVMPEIKGLTVYLILLSVNLFYFILFIIHITSIRKHWLLMRWGMRSFVLIDALLASLTFYSTQRGSSLFFEFVLITMLIFMFPIYNPKTIWSEMLASAGGAVFTLTSSDVYVPIAWQDICDLAVFYFACIACVIYRWIEYEKHALTAYSLKKSREAVYHESRTDAMTGLRNRTALRGDFPRFLGNTITAAMLDIDSFKQINDTYGHLFGDQVLKDLGSCMETVYGNTDTHCYRYGGDEFLIISVRQPAEAFHTYLCEVQKRFSCMRSDPVITVSIGYAQAEALEEQDIRHCIQRADENLYRVKSSGKGYIQGN